MKMLNKKSCPYFSYICSFGSQNLVLNIKLNTLVLRSIACKGLVLDHAGTLISAND